MQWLPDSLSWPVAAGLIVFSFFMSAMTAVLGVGGGTGMLAVMAGIFPPVTLIPIHGVVQLGSNGGRALVMLKHVHRKIFGYFFAGGLIGTAAAANLFMALPTGVLQIVLAIFILFLVWAPTIKNFNVTEKGFFGVGLIVNFLGIFLGAVGPIVGACLSAENLPRHTVVATQGACVSSHYLMKTIAFGIIGFAYAPWLFFIVAMLIAGFIGTMAGGRLLDKLPEKSFTAGFKVVLTVFALELFWEAVS